MPPRMYFRMLAQKGSLSSPRGRGAIYKITREKKAVGGVGLGAQDWGFQVQGFGFSLTVLI